MAAIIKRRWLPLASFSPANILAKLLTVDGSGSGLDADTVDGSHIETGSWTPTLTNVANVAATTASECWYVRIGNIVLVGGRFRNTRTAAALTETSLGISLPIASSFVDVTDAWGSLGLTSSAGAESGRISADTGSARLIATWFSVTTANVFTGFSGGYVIK